MRRAAALALFSVVNFAAIAEPNNPAPAAPAAQAKPQPKTETPPPGGVQAKTQTPAAPNAAAPAVLSQSKFLGMLYAEIAKRTPAENTVGKGDVAASFHVNGQGKVDKVVIEKTSSPAHAELVKKILAAVQAPQPPGGGADISQNFKFH
jgi:hypothetical protein